MTSNILKIISGIFLFLIAYVIIVISALPVFIFVISKKIIRGDNSGNIIDYIDSSTVGLDQAGGGILYGMENITVSSYTFFLCKYRNKYCYFMKFIDFIFGNNHCLNSFNYEMYNDKEDIEHIMEIVRR